MAQQEDEWFSTWFDSPYYHILYRNRDLHEAQLFTDRLLVHLHPNSNNRILNPARGRRFSNTRLDFCVYDRRPIYKPACFGFALSPFTSIGYLNNKTGNAAALAAAAGSLKPGDKPVIDFTDTGKIIGDLGAEEEKKVNGINFRVTRGVENGFIIKAMRFADGGREYRFEERGRVLREEDFRAYFSMVQLRLMEVFRDYAFSPFVREESARMVFVLKK